MEISNPYAIRINLNSTQNEKEILLRDCSIELCPSQMASKNLTSTTA
jgi:hypothetical protein